MKFQVLIRSWKSTIVGVASGILAILAASKHNSIQEALADGKVQIEIVIMILGLVSKDADVSGEPKPVEENKL